MKLLAVCVLALVAFVAAEDWWLCDKAAPYHLKIDSLTFDPSPLQVGKPFSLTLKGNLDKSIRGGKSTMDVSYLGVKILSKTVMNCDYPALFKCPTDVGPHTYSISDTIPAVTPRGTYSGKLSAVDQDGEQIICIQFKTSVKMGLDDPVVDMSIVNLINSDPKSTWTAGVNNQFEGMTVREAQKLLGAHVNAEATMPELVYRAANLPESFDARTQWPNCPHAIRDQGHCGSCWAFAISEAMSERLCVAKKESVVLSPQYFVSCDKQDLACQGGYLDRSWNFAHSEGTVTETCFPYKSGSGSVPACITECEDKKKMDKYKTKGQAENPQSLDTVMTALMTDGPIEAAFIVYQDFMNYKSGVYEHKTGGQVGGHAVKCMGWGVENGVKYWLLANSWGTSWATYGGYFKFIRGTNNCQIESNLWFAKM